MDNLGFLSFFVFEYLDADRSRFSDVTKEEFINEYRVDDILFERFVDYSVNRGLKMDFYDYEDPLKLYIKAALADQLFGPNIHAKIKGTADAMLLKVLDLDRPMIRQAEADKIDTTN